MTHRNILEHRLHADVQANTQTENSKHGDGPPIIVGEGGGLVHIRIYRRGEHCKIPDGAEFLLLLAEGVDLDGNWVPYRATTARDDADLKQRLQSIIAAADRVVVRARNWFRPLANGLGLRHLFSEWANI